jgi:hypothetical protein
LSTDWYSGALSFQASAEASDDFREEAVKQRYARTAVAVVALLAMGLVGAAAYAAVTSGPGRIELSATEFDFGAVPNTGPVSHEFQVRNAGRGPLEISGVSTSCGCTTAEVESQHLEQGESTTLRVTFDPQAHDGAVGEYLRMVYVRSNDPATPEASLTIRVTVVAPQPAGTTG